jgi:hypothetical protein
MAKNPLKVFAIFYSKKVSSSRKASDFRTFVPAKYLIHFLSNFRHVTKSAERSCNRRDRIFNAFKALIVTMK